MQHRHRAGQANPVNLVVQTDDNACINRSRAQQTDQIGAVDQMKAAPGAMAGKIQRQHRAVGRPIAQMHRPGRQACLP